MSNIPGPGRRARRLAMLLTTAVVGALALGGSAQAETQLTQLTHEPFAHATTTDNGWVRPSAGTNVACLTASNNTTQQPIKGCATSAIDSAGSGTLRLTGNGGSLVGTVYNTTSLPTAQGLHVTFDTYQWNATSSNGADGISFILAATDPANPAPPTTTGPNGGSLGYSPTQSNNSNGVAFGYLGFGLDVFGNFQNSAFGGDDCAASSATPQSITVRGPGSGMNGYCILDTVVANSPLDVKTATTRPAAVPAEIAINPSATASTTDTGLTVPAKSWLFKVTPTGGTAQTRTGALPAASTLSGYGFPAGWVNPATGLPYQLTFGWAASTGGSNEIHEINRLESSTLNGQLPSFQLAVSDNVSGKLIAGNRATVGVTPSLAPAEGSEAEDVSVTTTMPAGLTPGAATGPGYTCTTASQVVTCRYDTTDPIAAGSALPQVQIPVTVAANATGTLTVTAKVSSNDGKPATASGTLTAGALGASVAPSSTPYGTGALASMTGLPSNATGSVAFTTGGTPLCTATLPATSCTTSPIVPVGTRPVVATYSGDDAYASQAVNASYTVTKATAALTTSATPNSVPYGTTSTLSTVLGPNGATGTLTYSTGGTTLCTVTLPDTACDTPLSLGAGTYTVTATYSGDGNVGPGTATTGLTVTKAATGFTAAPADPSLPYGTANTLAFTGLPENASGTVTFTSGGTTLCTVTLPGTSCATPDTLVPGEYAVTATYSGDANHEGSTATTGFEVVKAATDVVAGVTTTPVVYGSAATLTHSGLPETATGTVTFTSGGTTLCTATLPATACSTSADLAATDYPVTATYSGDGNHLGSDDATAFAVSKDASAGFAAAATPESTVYGEAATLSFSGLASTATGTVTFTTGDTTLCTATLPATGCSAPADLGAGEYPVTATYSGDGNHDGATDTTGFAVRKAATAVTAAPADPTVPFGQEQTLAYSGLPEGATGTVTFTTGDTTLCTATLPATGCSAPADLDAGEYPVTATYSGDANHQGSTDETSFVVTKRTSPEFTAIATPASTVYGTPDTLSFTGLAPLASGEVTFTSGGTTLCTVRLPADSCRTAADLTAGEYDVSASYGGDANHAAATDATRFVVAKATTDVDAQIGAASAPEGSRVVLTAGNLPAAATGTVTFSVGSTELCTVTLPRTACAVIASTDPGTYTITARYSGDVNHAGSADTVRLRVTAVEQDSRTVSTPGGQTTTTPIPGAEDARSVEITHRPEHGTATIVDGRVVYTPEPGFVGTDTVTVRVVAADGTVRVVTLKVRVGGSQGRTVDRLPTTGTSLAVTTAAGAVMLLVGAVAVWSTRNRRA